jgi:hypothetical protein
MTKDEALDKALEALDLAQSLSEKSRHHGKILEAITAIKQARSAQVQEPVAWIFKPNRELLWPNEVERKNPLELNEYAPLYTTPPAAPVQEPESFEQWNAKQHADPEEIGFLQALRIAYCAGQDSVTNAVPPAAQRQWVGLTDEAIWSEYQTLWPFHPAEESRLAKDIAKFARAIEAKLKEKNT